MLESTRDFNYITTPGQLESILGRSETKEAREITPEVVFAGHIRFAPEEVHPFETLDNFYRHYAAEWAGSQSENNRYSAALMGGKDEWEKLTADPSVMVRCAVAQAADEEIQISMAEDSDVVVRQALCIYGSDKVRMTVFFYEADREQPDTDVLRMAVEGNENPYANQALIKEYFDRADLMNVLAQYAAPDRTCLSLLARHDDVNVRESVCMRAADNGFFDIADEILKTNLPEITEIELKDYIEDCRLEQKTEQNSPSQNQAPQNSAQYGEKIILTAETTDERVTELQGKVGDSLARLTVQGHLGDVITTMTKFPRYSVDNAILITAQAPNATHLLNSRAWEEKFQKRIKKGEKSIKVIAPGKTKKVISVFDTAQLQGGAPEIEKKALADEQLDKLIENLKNIAPFEVEFEPIADEFAASKYDDEKNLLTVNSSADKPQIARSILANIIHCSFSRTEDIVLDSAKEKSINALACANLSLEPPDYFTLDRESEYLSKFTPEQAKEFLGEIHAFSKQLASDVSKGKIAAKTATAQEENLENAPLPEKENPEPKGITVTITKSENEHFTVGQSLDFAAANSLVAQADSENKDVSTERIEYRIELEIDGEKFTYNAQQDLGAGDGSIADHIREYHEYCLAAPEWKQHVIDTRGEEAWERESAISKAILEKIVPQLERENPEEIRAEPEPAELVDDTPKEVFSNPERRVSVRQQIEEIKQRQAASIPDPIATMKRIEKQENLSM